MAHKDIIQVKKDLKNGNIHPIYLLQGEETYLIDTLAETIDKSVLDESLRDFNQSIFYGKDTDIKSLLDALRRYPMMAERQVVMLREAQDMKDFKDLSDYVKNPTDTTVFIISYKHKTLDQRTSLAKELKKNGKVYTFKKLYDNQVGPWIINYLKAQKFTIGPQEAELIAQHVGNNLSTLVNELSKLTSNLSSTEIDATSIERYIGISKDYNVFEWQKAIGHRQAEKVIQITTYFMANIKAHHPVYLISILNGYFEKVYAMQSCYRQGDAAMIKAGGINKFFLNDYKMAMRKYSPSQINHIFQLLLTYDLKLKGVDNVSNSPEQLLKELVVQILNVK